MLQQSALSGERSVNGRQKEDFLNVLMMGRKNKGFYCPFMNTISSRF
jgi:hypothetical protein